MRSSAQYSADDRVDSQRGVIMKTFPLLGVSIVIVGALAVPRAQQTPPTTLDTAAIGQALGIAGQLQGDVYRVGMPRTDLKVTIHGIAIKPGLALGSWAAFRRSGSQAIVH